MLTIRAASAHELPALSDLCLRSKAVWGYDAGFLAACRDELSLTRDDLATTQVAVAELEGKVVGVVEVSIDGNDADLEKLFVDPDCLRCGAGRVLFAWAVETARAAGAARLVIDSDLDAAGFYRRMGAVAIGEAPSVLIPGRMLPRLALVLPPLTAPGTPACP